MSQSARKGTPAMNGADSDQPIEDLFHLLGRRWVLRIVWELRAGRETTFRELQELCGGVSPTVLNSRLRELRGQGLVEHRGGYRLTDEGQALFESLKPLVFWANRWQTQQKPSASRKRSAASRSAGGRVH
ncbi:MAG: helix-turn-helix transcriptional regulator [Ectothiorhodospiraceae bacterium]|nr:helix-turn-helix transcriptional regulator [Ectothiorhodospiraceae bacterium]MCH8506576.1 helix-turn-helix transcriptional regulator [Ectothiorhodospiraceae bacterium]